MKKLLFVCLLASLLPFSNLNAQETETETETEQTLYPRRTSYNELSLNVLNVLVFGALDASYERVLNENSTVGVEIFSKVFNKNEGEDVDLSKVYAKDLSITGKFKFFFEEGNNAWGFYAEGFGMLSDGTNDKDVTREDPLTGNKITTEEELDYTDFALGFGVGGKFVAKQGFLIDVSFGLGRNLFNKNSPDLVILPAVNVGYRF
ncbi:hypothetical protein [Salinimicrobium soli]|uniref:hypothetical protein n=1 Tax=Salinimicrobium soli TaxID=1254399 RepID=UPI003AAF052A